MERQEPVLVRTGSVQRESVQMGSVLMASGPKGSVPRVWGPMVLVLKESVPKASVWKVWAQKELVQMALVLRVLVTHSAQGSHSEMRSAIH